MQLRRTGSCYAAAGSCPMRPRQVCQRPRPRPGPRHSPRRRPDVTVAAYAAAAVIAAVATRAAALVAALVDANVDVLAASRAEALAAVDALAAVIAAARARADDRRVGNALTLASVRAGELAQALAAPAAPARCLRAGAAGVLLYRGATVTGRGWPSRWCPRSCRTRCCPSRWGRSRRRDPTGRPAGSTAGRTGCPR